MGRCPRFEEASIQSNVLDLLVELTRRRKTFAVATVIEVVGSASARVGSRAVFDNRGVNVCGWVGGGCAEQFVGDESVAAIAEREPRVVLADLDDEVFGLGVACGGTMRVFIEPHFPPEKIELPRPVPAARIHEVSYVLERLGMEPVWTDDSFEARSVASVIVMVARAIAAARGASGEALRDIRPLPVRFAPVRIPPLRKAILVGQSRITEALARWFVQLGMEVLAIAPALDESRFPAGDGCRCLQAGYSSITFTGDAAAVVASHHATDPGMVEQALRAGSPYVAFVASAKRVADALSSFGYAGGDEVSLPLFAPAGIDLDARNPEEIAFSIAAQIAELQGNGSDSPAGAGVSREP